MTPERAENYCFDIRDITKVWPHGDFPPIIIGKLILNRNPTNYFGEVEQAAFSPANLVPGIGILQTRCCRQGVFSYHDTHIHRLGPNYNLIPVNAPKHSPENSYQRDGFMRVDANGGSGLNYWPNSFGGSAPDSAFLELPFDVSGLAARKPYKHPNDDFVQAGNLYRDVMTDQDRENLIENIVSHLSAAQKRIQLRQTALFFKADRDYGSLVAQGLALDIKEVERLANMTNEERARATEE